MLCRRGRPARLRAPAGLAWRKKTSRNMSLSLVYKIVNLLDFIPEDLRGGQKSNSRYRWLGGAHRCQYLVYSKHTNISPPAYTVVGSTSWPVVHSPSPEIFDNGMSRYVCASATTRVCLSIPCGRAFMLITLVTPKESLIVGMLVSTFGAKKSEFWG